MKFLWLGIGFAVGNVACGYLYGYDWSVAVERSFFQAAAIAACWGMSTLAPAELGGER